MIGIETEDIPVWQWMRDRGAVGFAEAIAQLMPLGGILVIATVIFSSTSALNATTYSATRVSFALGRDRFLPGMLSNISRRTKVPHIALLFSGILIVAMAIALPIEDVVSGEGNIHTDPLFQTGDCGDYYLSSIAAGQASDSDCIGAGSMSVAAAGLADRTTRTDNVADEGTVDVGYHYPIPARR